jgi:hypothetical protein
MTKALGERVAEHLWADAGHRLTVVRPTIIESALAHPHPGWIDGFKVADPLIAAYGKGRLTEFPGSPATVLDVIPVDLVVNAILAAADRPPAPASAAYLHVGSGASNPMTLGELARHAKAYFSAHPWLDHLGQATPAADFQFCAPERIRRRINRQLLALSLAQRAVRPAPAAWTRRVRQWACRSAQKLTLLRDYMKLYQPYSCSATVFDDTRARALHAEVTAAGQDSGFDVRALDWGHYLTAVHMPALAGLMRAQSAAHRAARRARDTTWVAAPAASAGMRALHALTPAVAEVSAEGAGQPDGAQPWGAAADASFRSA